ncbi:MAG: B12-binding domain-containing radical SAM protein [bacterium]|nr:B12-binding domain-containing radical SAM protein [bacterium]
MINRVLLIVPPTGLYIREDRCQTPIERLKTVTARPPIDLLYIAASLESAGVQCRIKDYPVLGGTWESLKQDILDFQPEMMVISITTPSLDSDMQACNLAKEVNPRLITVAKGAHFTFLDIAALEQYPNLDIVIRGEYELTAKELVTSSDWRQIAGITYRVRHPKCPMPTNINGNSAIRNPQSEIMRNPDRPFLENLDELPFPARHLIDNRLYIRPDTGEPQTTVITNRGCPYTCIFCLSTQVAGLKLRMRTPENIIAELQECVHKHQIRNFLFRADTFTLNKPWILELCQKIREMNLNISWACNSRVDTIDAERLQAMKDAGCWLIAFGIETGNEPMLVNIKKQTTLDQARAAIRLCKQYKIKTSVYFLIGLPWESKETFAESVQFAKELDPEFIEFFYAYPFPGTEFYEIAVAEKLLAPGEIPKSAYDSPAIPSLYLSIEELKQLRTKALRQFYFRPSYVFRTLKNAGTVKQMVNYLRYGFKQLADLAD